MNARQKIRKALSDWQGSDRAYACKLHYGASNYSGERLQGWFYQVPGSWSVYLGASVLEALDYITGQIDADFDRNYC